MSTVSKNIKRLRIQRKLTQEEIADKLYVTRQTVSNWETGKSQPDIDTLVKIAETLNTDTNVLIYGFPDASDRQKEKRRLIVSGVVLLALGLLLYFLYPLADRLKATYFLTGPIIILSLYVFPVFWLVLGWAAIQGLGVLEIIKPARPRSGRIIHITVLVIVLAYAVLMLPFLIYLISSTVLQFQFIANPSLFSDHLDASANFPEILTNIYWVLLDAMYRQHALFVIPGVVYRLSQPAKSRDSSLRAE